jgi:hypothetical protein
MSSAWIFQKTEQIEKLGAEAASWYVGWYEPNGRRKKNSCGPGGQGKKTAQRLARKIESELMTGTYQMKSSVLWDDFVKEDTRRTLDGRPPRRARKPSSPWPTSSSWSSPSASSPSTRPTSTITRPPAARMQHASYQTTQVYINITRQLKPAAHKLFVPPTRPAQPPEAGQAS